MMTEKQLCIGADKVLRKIEAASGKQFLPINSGNYKNKYLQVGKG